MRRSARILGLALLVVSALATPAIARDQDTFNRLLAKIGPDLGFGKSFKPRTACVCFNSVPTANRIGAISNVGGFAACLLPGFDGNGALNTLSSCNDWALLGH